MSYQGIPSFTNLPEETRSPKNLAASRWAPGGAEDQIIANKMNGVEMTGVKLSNDKASTTTAATTKGLASSRWSTNPSGHNQADKKKAMVTGNQKNKNNNENAASTALKHCRRGTNNYKTAPTANTMVTPCRIIGPLSEEEKTVKMENPFFNPNKHKGLGSSRWATE